MSEPIIETVFVGGMGNCMSLFLTLFGAGLGPLMTGAFSDIFSTGDNGEGLKYALVLMLSLLVLSAWFYFKAMSPYHQHMQATKLSNESAPELANETPTLSNENPVASR